MTLREDGIVKDGVFIPHDKNYIPRWHNYSFGTHPDVQDNDELKLGEICRCSYVMVKARKDTHRGQYAVPEWSDIVDWLIEGHSDILERMGYLEDGVLTLTEGRARQYARTFDMVVVNNPQNRAKMFWETTYIQLTTAIDKNFAKMVEAGFENDDKQKVWLNQVRELMELLGVKPPKGHHVEISGTVASVSVDELAMASRKAKEIEDSLPPMPSLPEGLIIDDE